MKKLFVFVLSVLVGATMLSAAPFSFSDLRVTSKQHIKLRKINPVKYDQFVAGEAVEVNLKEFFDILEIVNKPLHKEFSMLQGLKYSNFSMIMSYDQYLSLICQYKAVMNKFFGRNDDWTSTWVKFGLVVPYAASLGLIFKGNESAKSFIGALIVGAVGSVLSGLLIHKLFINPELRKSTVVIKNRTQEEIDQEYESLRSSARLYRDVVITGVAKGQEIMVIKFLRELTGMQLHEVARIVTGGKPAVALSSLPKDEAQKIADMLTAEGAQVEVTEVTF